MPSIESSSSKSKLNFSGANRLVRRIAPDLEVGVVQDLFASDSFRRIEVEGRQQEICRERVGMEDKGGKRNSGLDGKRVNILLDMGRTNTAKITLRWCSQIV